ncbi:MAG TPA: hypothetical protein VGJ70_05635 [Solirubrobacteraceae bacterium]
MIAAGLVAVPCTAAQAADGVVAPVDYPGVQHLHYRYGPIQITPGQNTIVYRPTTLKPSVPGYITRFTPNLKYSNGKVPRVDILHLHHGVWLMRGYPTFAAGEEKTITQFPKGFGYRYDPKDPWLLNYMLHNLITNRASVYLTWDIDFVPAAAARTRAAPSGPRSTSSSASPRRSTPPWSPPAGTCTPAGCTSTSTSRAARGRSGSSAPRPSTSNRPARSRGTSP